MIIISKGDNFSYTKRLLLVIQLEDVIGMEIVGIYKL